MTSTTNVTLEPTINKDLENVSDGIWFISDLHLTDKELTSTKGMVENSSIILDSIIKKLENNPQIKMIVFLGDIQHGLIYNRRLVVSWLLKFKRIREIMENRLQEFNDDELKVYVNNELVPLENVNPVITLKGNHDFDKNKKYTLFDEIEELGYVGRYDKFILKGVQYNLYDYGKEIKIKDNFKREDDVNYLIALCHHNIWFPNSMFWLENALQKGEALSITKLKGFDVCIVGHIHDRQEIIEYRHNKEEKTIFWYAGCIARTHLKDSTKRNEGYSSLIDNTNLKIYKCDIKILPYKRYFKLLETGIKKERKNTLKDFNLNLNLNSDNIVSYDSYEDEIMKIEDVDIDVKIKSIELIKDVEKENCK